MSRVHIAICSGCPVLVTILEYPTYMYVATLTCSTLPNVHFIPSPHPPRTKKFTMVFVPQKSIHCVNKLAVSETIHEEERWRASNSHVPVRLHCLSHIQEVSLFAWPCCQVCGPPCWLWRWRHWKPWCLSWWWFWMSWEVYVCARGAHNLTYFFSSSIKQKDSKVAGALHLHAHYSDVYIDNASHTLWLITNLVLFYIFIFLWNTL